ncbi:hypothetical protein PR003_g17685 [Phytophthora rubi]|uniref:DUF6604 domain-containing protein n=1 Tax=Phytophthora rubi TaxID=129364 RepID=A0A6A4ED69_9STRA|nr:hypothetical protein PR003_g17685 [Phytophthora rubi]
MSQFPASKYVRYKRATSFFLDWLLRARDHGHNSSKHVRLETLNEVVAKVAAEPSTLTPALLKDFPKALAACQCAITMREHVAAFFADAEHGHQHFLKLLQSWLSTLKGVAVEPHQNDDGTTSSAELESQAFNNYYEVLEVDEDYFPDEGTYVAEPTAAKNFKVDRQRLLDEAFAEDMRLEVAYFFIELEELAQNVFNVYDQVKKQQRTMVEATVVAKLAMDVAGSLAATLQLRYPSLRDGLDFVEVIMQTDVESLSARMEDAYNATRKSLKNEGVFTFVPGSPVGDLEQKYCVFSSFFIGKSNDGVCSKASPSTTTSALSEEVQRVAVESTSSSTPDIAGKKKKKCKKKNKKKTKNKKGKVKGDQVSSTPKAIAGDDDLAEVSKLLMQLLVSVGADTKANDDQAGVSLMENALRQTAAAVFTRLRDTSIPVHRKAQDTQHARKLIERLQELVKDFSTPDKLTSTASRTRNMIFSEASRVIYLMQRFHRTDHPVVTVPALSPVRDFCDTSASFTQFVLSTARVGVSVDKKSQAQDILDLLEKRLLVLKRLRKVILLDFRGLVQMYAKAREEMGLGKTSSRDSLRALEWYLTNTVDDYVLQRGLDKLDGKPFYSDLVITDSQDCTVFEDAIAEIPAITCYTYGDGVTRVVFGGPREAVVRRRKLVVALAEKTGVQLSKRDSKYCVTSLRVGEFVFSADGVVRDTALG